MKLFSHIIFLAKRVFGNSTVIMLVATAMMPGITQGQSKAGLSPVADTSYNTYSAFLQTRKSHPDTREVALANLPEVARHININYAAIGPRTLQLDVFAPASNHTPGKTAIIIIHGGGWRSGNRTQHHPLAERLAARGYVCFTPEYRLSTEALFPAAVYDIKSVIRWVRSQAAKYGIDTSRVVALGFSAGGELAAFMGTTGNMPLFEGNNGATIGSHVNAVVDIDGTLSFVHPEGGEGDDSKRTSAATHWFGYSKKENPVLWQAASPLSYVGQQTPPTLFLNSAVSRMHAGREDYIKVLNEHGTYSEVHSFEGAPHSFCLFDPWFQPTVNYIDDFLKRVFRSSNNQES